MFRQFVSLIEKHDNIIIIRHQNPDLDAFGSQFGLYYMLQSRYSDKTILVGGDTNNLNHFRDLDPLEEDDYAGALVIILDTVSRQMLENSLFERAAAIVLIDHHQNDPDIRYDLMIKDPTASSTTELLARLFLENGWTITRDIAEALYTGLVSDTGRFLYRSVTPTTFRIAAALLETGIDIQTIHDRMYAETLAMKKLKSIFSASISFTSKNVAYRRNDAAFLEDNGVDSHTVSRGLVNQMSGIEEVPIWANFTYDQKTGRILCELRSRRTPILDVARKFGGGGHLLACGCIVDTWEQTDEILAELDRKTEE
jgi:phosphoesterase RecJ-like protein